MKQAANASPPRLPDWLVQNRNFVLLWAAYGVAAIGDHLSEQALLKSRGGLERPDVTRLQALMSVGFFFPFVVLGPLAGWWSDRFSRKSTMVLADLLRAAIVFNMAFIVSRLVRWLPADLGDYSIVIPLAVVGSLAAFFSPARQAMLPTLIRDDQLVRANALIRALGTIGTIISAVVGGWLVDHVGPEWNFHINAMTFTLSAIFVGTILMSRSRQVSHPKLEGVWTPLRQGFRYVRQHRRVLQMVLLGTVFWAAAGAVIAVVPAIVKVYFGESYTAAGTFRGIMGIGLASGAAIMTIIGPTLPLSLGVLVSLAAAAAWILLLGVCHSLHLGKILTGVSLFGIGGAGAALLVSIMATIQRFVPDSRRGRVFGVSDTLTMGAMVAASAAIGLPKIPNLDRYIPAILALTVLGLAAALVIAWRVYRRGSEHPPRTWVTIRVIRFFTHFWCRAKRIGPCTLPAKGPALLAANHTTGIDPIMIIGTSPLRLPAFLVAREYYAKPFVKFFCTMNHCIPINRDNPGKSFLTGALRLLEAGHVLGIFPQGRFQIPGQPESDALAGIGAIALRTGVPVIPVHISGTQYRDDPFASFLVRHNVRIRYGRQIDLSRFKGRERDKEAAREATELIMQHIRALGDSAADDDANATGEQAAS
ncbi:MAG: MFS transporter [Planctomycetes bacterium]|nr:MFS transporter [Planctomycetota bacterium]